MNWKDKFIIAWLNKKANSNLNQQFLYLTKGMNENSTKYKTYKIIKERYFDNSPELQKQYFKWFILQLPKLPKEIWNTKTPEEIINIPEIQDNIYSFISAFEQIKDLENNDLLTKSDIDKIKTFKTITELQSIISNIYSSKHLEINKQEFESEEEIPKIIYSYNLDNNHYDVYLPLTVKQFLYIGDNNKGTTWCFGENEKHAHSYYLKAKNKDYVYVIYKNNKPFAALHEGTNQYHGTDNLPLDYNKILDIMPVLEKFKLYSALFYLYNKNIISKEELNNLIDINKIITNPKYAVNYAKQILKSRWPQDKNGKIAEYNIAKDAESAYEYAKNYLPDKKWDENTKIGQLALTSIAKNAKYAYLYVENCLPDKKWDENTPWGELALTSIAKNAEYAFKYINYLPDKKWDENTPWGELALTSIAKNADFACEYAKNCLPDKQWDENTPWGELALNTIAQSTQNACWYAYDCLPDKQWNENSPIGQLALTSIANSVLFAFEYAFSCLPNKQWKENTYFGQLALTTIAQDSHFAFEYAKKCLPDKQWKENSPIGQLALTSIAKNADFAYWYARDCLPDKQWKENSPIGQLALTTIAKSVQHACYYAEDCLPNHQWDENSPIGQLAIKTLKNTQYWNDYCELSRI